MEKEINCPLRYLQSLLGGKWKMPIVCMLVIPIRNLFRQMRKSAHGSLDFRKISE